MAAMPREPLPLHLVMLEVIAVGHSTEGGLVGRRRCLPLRPGTAPAAQVKDAAGVTEDDRRTLVHGTSWRLENDALHLTWIVAPDPQPEGEGQRIPIGSPAEGQHGRLDDPTPTPPTIEDVALHAVRHAAWLAAQNPSLFAEARDPDLWATIAGAGTERARTF